MHILTQTHIYKHSQLDGITVAISETCFLLVNQKLGSMQQKLDRRQQLESNENCISSYTSKDLEGISQGSRDNIVSVDALGNIISGTSLWCPTDLMATKACELLQQANGGHNRREKLRGNTETFRLPKSDGNSSLQNENVGTIVFPTMGEHPRPATPVGPIGHSIAWMPHPHSEPNLLGSVQAPGQPSVHQDFHGLHNARMVLPIELAEEPVYVNAKQYHGILRRRQLRAKAELENKVPKVRKPYLHESRHLHAMRRARGCGGRFLSSKKFKGDASKATSEIGTSSGANDNGTRSSQDSELAFPISSGNVHFAANYGEVGNHSLQGRQNSDLPWWGSCYQWRSQ